MKRSIRTKLFIGATGLVMFFVIFSLALNSYFLEPYYLFQKKKMLTENAKYINNIYNDKNKNISLEFEKIERSNGIHIVIADSSNNVIYDSAHKRFGDIVNKKLQPEVSVIQEIDKSLFTNNKFVFIVAQDRRLNTQFLNLACLLNNGNKLLLNIPLQEIKEGSNIANKFLVFTGLITIFLGIIITFIYSKKFTEPILNLSRITQSMSKLNFKEKYIVKSEDEIGILGKNINFLCEQLDKSIEELKEKNRMLSEDIEKERKLDEMRKEFIANVSHELKTPISLIQGYAEGLKLNVIESEEDKNFYCDVIVNESTKMNNLVKKLLNLSLINSGRIKLEKRKFNISELINEVVSKFTSVFENKNINLTIKNDYNLIVNGDMLLIEQVLVNYINNALNHIDDKKQIHIGTCEMENKVRITVFNSGKPIPDDSVNKIWESFYKVDKARTRAYGGTGLGLSIVSGIQKLHGNEYGVINRKDGVDFWFDIDRVV